MGVDRCRQVTARIYTPVVRHKPAFRCGSQAGFIEGPEQEVIERIEVGAWHRNISRNWRHGCCKLIHLMQIEILDTTGSTRMTRTRALPR